MKTQDPTPHHTAEEAEKLRTEMAQTIFPITPDEATHYRVKPQGYQRGKIIERRELPKFFQMGAEIVCGLVRSGKFVVLKWLERPKPLAPTPPPANPRLGMPPRGTGYVATIDHLLFSITDKTEVKGFVRSDWTFSAAIAHVHGMFPEKDPKSVKNVVRVRPRILEKTKGSGFDDQHRAPRWALVDRPLKEMVVRPEKAVRITRDELIARNKEFLARQGIVASEVKGRPGRRRKKK